MPVPLDGLELAEQDLELALAIGTGAQAGYTLFQVFQQKLPGGYITASAKVSGFREPLLAGEPCLTVGIRPPMVLI